MSTRVSEKPATPEEIYGQTDPKSWDPFSRADRIAKVNNYCIHPATTDEGLRRSLDFMERKASLATESRIQAQIERERAEQKRTLFNLKYTPVATERANTETERQTLHSHVSEYIINCIQISEFALSRGFERAAYRCQYYRRKINQSAWLENQFINSKSEISNTFFLSSQLEQSILRMRNHSDEVPDWRLPKNLTRDTLDEALRSLQQATRFSFGDMMRHRDEGKQSEFILESSTRDAFFSVIHEVIENAMSHGVHSSINPHSVRSELGDFGKVFLLQATTESYTDKKASNSNIFPGAFGDFHYNGTLRRKKSTRYRVITFYDTGLGVQRHLEKFGGMEGSHSISEIAKNGYSSRPIVGSGKGFEKMKAFTRGLKAFLAVATPSSTYTYNGITNTECEVENGKVLRGTIITLFLREP